MQSRFCRTPTAFLVFLLSLFACLEANASLPQDAGKNLPLGCPISQDENFCKRHPLARLEDPKTTGGPNELTTADAARITNQAFQWQKESEDRPRNQAQSGAANAQSQQSSAANAIGEVARDQGVNAIEFTSKFLTNFTASGNKWNDLRNQIFLPIAVLLLLPGAVLAQVKAIAAAGNSAIEQVSPLDGIFRSIVAIFLIPGSILVVNYGIDFANSVSHTIASEYQRVFGKNMYKEAICAEIRAFTPRHAAENDSSLKIPPFNDTPFRHGIFSRFESDWGKLYDPCLGINLGPRDRDDGAAAHSTIIKRFILNSINATLNITWGILTAFQAAFLYYLFFAGPIMAALWVWPLKMFKEAFGHWMESVLTLCFWSLFWNMTILLMAALKGSDDTGIMMMSALDLLAVMSVKFAFDSASIGRGAAQTAERLVNKAVQEAGKGGGGGGGGGKGASKSGGKGRQ